MSFMQAGHLGRTTPCSSRGPRNRQALTTTEGVFLLWMLAARSITRFSSVAGLHFVFRHDESILIQVGVGLEETVQNESQRRGIQCGGEA